MMDKPLDYYVFDNYDFFRYDSVSSNEYVIAGIKPAYQLLLDIVNFPVDGLDLDMYINGSDFQKHYETARKMVSQYISDVYNNTGLQEISKYNLLVIVAKNNDSTYVIKGEFVLRVINDFNKGKIKLAGIRHDELMRFIEENTPSWKNSIIQMRQIDIQIDSNNLEEYFYLLDRYEIYDEKFFEETRNVLEIFFVL